MTTSALLTLADRLEKAADCLMCGGLRYVTEQVHYGHDWTAYVDCPYCTDIASLRALAASAEGAG